MEDKNSLFRSARRSFSVIGFAFAVLIAVVYLTQLAFVLIPQRLGWDGLTEQPWWTWVFLSAPMYLFAFPACCLMLRMLPGDKPEGKKLTVKQFLALIPICFCLMYGGNLLGTFLSWFLSDGNAVNALDSYAMDTSPLKILVMVILAPLLEELICRKLLIDRTVRYGEKISVLMSGLIFGLLHQNLYQFFYAFALGSLFGYVYVRTGRVRYTIILHTMINFLGAVVAPALVSMLNTDTMIALMSETGNVTPEAMMEVAPVLLLVFGYSMAILGLSIGGLVLLILKCRKLTWKETTYQLPGKLALKASFLNVGMIVYILICLIMIILAVMNFKIKI